MFFKRNGVNSFFLNTKENANLKLVDVGFSTIFEVSGVFGVLLSDIN